jgi:ABC-2 type transport system ATP-binding protein
MDLDVRTEGTTIRQFVGYMPEYDCLPPDTSATDFVTHMARMSGLPKAAARERTA